MYLLNPDKEQLVFTCSSLQFQPISSPLPSYSIAKIGNLRLFTCLLSALLGLMELWMGASRAKHTCKFQQRSQL